MITLLLALYLAASFPTALILGRVIRDANARQDAADERGEGLGVSFIHSGESTR